MFLVIFFIFNKLLFELQSLKRFILLRQSRCIVSYSWASCTVLSISVRRFFFFVFFESWQSKKQMTIFSKEEPGVYLASKSRALGWSPATASSSRSCSRGTIFRSLLCHLRNRSLASWWALSCNHDSQGLLSLTWPSVVRPRVVRPDWTSSMSRILVTWHLQKRKTSEIVMIASILV